MMQQDNEDMQTIKELFEGYDGDYVPEELDWSEPAGEEVW